MRLQKVENCDENVNKNYISKSVERVFRIKLILCVQNNTQHTLKLNK